MEVVRRRAGKTVRESLAAFRVVVLHGARQSGKTTLARIVARELNGEFVTLDQESERIAAASDPHTFVTSLRAPAVIDEVQRVGDPLVLAVKLVVDEDPTPGRVLMTGSTNFLTVPTISETLAGRIDLVTLWPLAMAEIEATPGDFIDRAFTEPQRLVRSRTPTPDRDAYLAWICRGGFPEVLRIAESSRRRWFTRYVETVVEREVEVAADIRRSDVLTSMVRLFAARTSQEHINVKVAELLGVDRTTAETYRGWLQTVFLVHLVPAWSRNVSTKVVHRPKLHMVDTGLAAALLGKNAAALNRPTDPSAGALVETFVVAELAKQLGWSTTPARIHHYRDSDGVEVDVVLEADDGRVCAIEVKSSATVRPGDARGIESLRDRLDRVGQDFVCGAVLYTGERRFTVSDRVVALPIADVWS